MKIEDEKVIAGISCGQVLERLSDYLDGDLPPEERERVEAHLRGCDGCSRFGGEFKATVSALRRLLGRPGGLPEGFRDRLRRSLSTGNGRD